LKTYVDKDVGNTEKYLSSETRLIVRERDFTVAYKILFIEKPAYKSVIDVFDGANKLPAHINYECFY